MQEAAYATLTSQLEAFWQNGRVPPRTGNASHGRVPINVYPTNDGYIAMNLAVEEHWHSLLKAMGREDLRDDPRFNSPAGRVSHRAETDALITAWTQTLGKREVVAVAKRHRIPLAPVRDVGEVMHDPHMHERGMLLRRTAQFHWRNEGYRDFEDFLARLSHARRKNIRQERRRVGEAGVTLRWLEGAAIERRHWEFFNRCYRLTYAAHRSSPYLNLEFFLRIGSTLPRHLAMVLAERAGRAIACALFLMDETALYGRYWGAIEHVPLLHFECCYYQPIEFAIGRGIEVFEGGAQGEHKLFRGLMPVEALSAHWLAHPRFSRAVEAFLGLRVRGPVGNLRDDVRHTGRGQRSADSAERRCQRRE
jgi:hypothetical protein